MRNFTEGCPNFWLSLWVSLLLVVLLVLYFLYLKALPSVWKTSFYISYSAYLLLTDFFSFCVSENNLYSPSFLNSFIGCRILDWHEKYFSQCFKDIASFSSCLHCFWQEICHLYVCSFVYIILSLSSSLSLIWSCLCLCVIVFMFLVLGVHWVS